MNFMWNDTYWVQMKLFQSLKYHPLSLLFNFSNISFQTYYGLSPSKQRANLIFLWRSWQGSEYLMLSLQPHKNKTFQRMIWNIKIFDEKLFHCHDHFNTNGASLKNHFLISLTFSPHLHFENYDKISVPSMNKKLNLVSAKTILIIPHKNHVR